MYVLPKSAVSKRVRFTRPGHLLPDLEMYHADYIILHIISPAVPRRTSPVPSAGGRAASFFSGVRIRLGKILGRFSIIYLRGLGLRIRVRVGLGLGLGFGPGLGLVWCYDQSKFRVRIRVRVGFGLGL